MIKDAEKAAGFGDAVKVMSVDNYFMSEDGEPRDIAVSKVSATGKKHLPPKPTLDQTLSTFLLYTVSAHTHPQHSLLFSPRCNYTSILSRVPLESGQKSICRQQARHNYAGRGCYAQIRL